MKPNLSIFLSILVLIFLASCAPVVTVQNNSSIGVRVAVMSSDGVIVVSTAPGESTAAEFSVGTYWASVIPDQDWISFARSMRDGLVEELAHPETMSSDQIIEVSVHLSDITEKINQYGNGGGGSKGYCKGKVSEESDGVIVVSEGQNGGLVINCK